MISNIGENLIKFVASVVIFKGVESYIPNIVLDKYAWIAIIAGVLLFLYAGKIQEMIRR